MSEMLASAVDHSEVYGPCVECAVTESNSETTLCDKCVDVTSDD